MTTNKKQKKGNSRLEQQQKLRDRKRKITGLMILGVIILVSAVAYSKSPTNSTSKPENSEFPYAVAKPASGAIAPNFSLPSTKGGTVKLSDYKGKSVLLFFHEGIGCQPCWDQIRDLERNQSQLKSAGVDELLTITSGPTRLIKQKMADDGLRAVALGDTNLEISKIYNANQFGMMGGSRDGHTFILIGPDGKIDWRADYGGPPRYTMYVPVAQLLQDMKNGQA